MPIPQITGRLCALATAGSLVLGCQRARVDSKDAPAQPLPQRGFEGLRAGDERVVSGIAFRWCPPGTFTMGSPPLEPERRPDEEQVRVTLSHGFWMGKHELTQGQWKRVAGKLPWPGTAELPEGEDFPVGNVTFAQTEAFLRSLTDLARASGELPPAWEFRLPPKRSGNTPAGPGRPRPPRSARS